MKERIIVYHSQLDRWALLNIEANGLAKQMLTVA
jgi:hypothetical protein